MSVVLEKFVIHADNVIQIAEWIRDGRGLAHWTSVDLSDSSFGLSTPALTNGVQTPKPSWKAGDQPDPIIFDPPDIEVARYELFRRFHVAIRRGRSGLSLKCTDGASRRIRAALASAVD